MDLFFILMILGFVMFFVFLIISLLISNKVAQIKDVRKQAIENASGIVDELSYLAKQYSLAEESGMIEYAIDIEERIEVKNKEFDKIMDNEKNLESEDEKKRREMWSFAILSIVGFALGLISMVIWLDSLI